MGTPKDPRENGIDMAFRQKMMDANKARVRKVEPVQFMGETIYVREVNDFQRRKIEQGRIQDVGTKKQKFDMSREPAFVIAQHAYVAAGPDALRCFQDGDEEYIKEFPASEVDRVYTKFLELNGMNPTAAEDAEKNSATTPTST